LTQVNFSRSALSTEDGAGNADLALQRAVLHDVKERFTIRDDVIAALRYRAVAQGITFIVVVASGVQTRIIHSTIP